MREIKFRAWAVASRVMFTPDTDDGWEFHYGKMYILPNTVVMQYTGLKDKNGKEIYEGDIVYNLGNGNCIVEYDIDCRGYEPFQDVFEWCDWSYNPPEDFEIIGNIHENPELL